MQRSITTMIAALFVLAAVGATATPLDDLPLALEPGQYMVGLTVVPRDLEEGHEYHGAEVLSINRDIDMIVVDVQDPLDFQVRSLLDPAVRYVEEDLLAFELPPLDPDLIDDLLPGFTPNDQYYGCCQWGIKDVGVEEAWDTTLGSTTVILAVLDTGLRKSHEDIGNYLQGWNFINGNNNPNDCNGHGTHVGSTAAGLTHNSKGVAGVAQARILPVKVLDCNGSGSFSAIINGITWSTNQGADIISMSLGASSGSTGLRDAVDYAWNNGALVVAAAGNDYGGPIGFPARYANAIAVTAYDQNRNLASFSNKGPEAEISAPGVQIAAAYHRSDSDYVYLDGTSMATPIVSGAAALALTVNPGLTNAQLRQMLRDTANDLGPGGWDQSFGYGGVNAAALVAAASGGGGGGGEQTVYFEDFEGGTQFTKSSGSTDWWRLSSGCHGGNTGRSLQFNRADSNCQYGSGSSRVTGWARTTVDLSGSSAATVSFDNKRHVESYSGGAYDIMRVQIATCPTCSWTTLEQWDSRSANQLSWKGESYDISAWAGNSQASVRFFFDSVDGTSNNYPGWAIDNFHVTKG